MRFLRQCQFMVEDRYCDQRNRRLIADFQRHIRPAGLDEAFQ
jgi:N-acetyl-anhydromuramyl-L-alanine amidase AmpD